MSSTRCSAQERQEGSTWIGSRVGRNWCTWRELAASRGAQHCACGFLLPPDISLRVPKCLPGPNPESQELPREKAMAVSVTGRLSTNGHLCDLPLLSTTELGSSRAEQGRGARKGRGGSQKFERVSSAGREGL